MLFDKFGNGDFIIGLTIYSDWNLLVFESIVWGIFDVNFQVASFNDCFSFWINLCCLLWHLELDIFICIGIVVVSIIIQSYLVSPRSLDIISYPAIGICSASVFFAPYFNGNFLIFNGFSCIVLKISLEIAECGNRRARLEIGLVFNDFKSIFLVGFALASL